MKKKIILLVTIIVIIGACGYWWMKRDSNTASPQEAAAIGSGATPEAIKEISTYAYTETFTHPVHRFMFKYPADFTVTAIPNETGEAIVVQNLKTNVGVQILVSPYDGSEQNLTEAVIRESLPDMQIKEPQELLLGEGGAAGKGLAFISDNENFGGKSREVWFVYRGNLYQISTYLELDEFLKGIFGTWQLQ